MPEFKVTFLVSGIASATITAKDADEAVEIATDLIRHGSDEYSYPELEGWQCEDVEEVEDV